MANIEKLADRSDRLRARHAALNLEHVRDSVVLRADAAFLSTYSGQLTWTLLVNLIARLYKGIRNIALVVDADIPLRPDVFVPVEGLTIREVSKALIHGIAACHVTVWDHIPQDFNDPIVVAVGRAGGTEAFAVAGRGWLAFLDDGSWEELTDDLNPLGPIVAACLGAAEIYRRLYVRDACSSAISFSVFDYSAESAANPPFPARLDIPRSYFAGAGAIGMAALFTILNVPSASASDGIHVVDDDMLEDTNLNRCILAFLDDVDKSKKVEIVDRFARKRGLDVRVHDTTWQEFLARPENSDTHEFERVISGVDKYASRLSVQYDRMPRILLTAGTADFLMSISRHELNNSLSCGACYQARDAEPGCGQQTEGAQQAFEQPVDPSIGFVSVLAGALLAGELLKEVHADWRTSAVSNTLRLTMNVLSPNIRTKVLQRKKDANCNCMSKYVALGYEETWGSL